MKKMFITILTVALLTLTAVPAFAATTPYVCPNGNTACVQNGACLTNGACVNHETCMQGGICQYPEGCPNGGVPKHAVCHSANAQMVEDAHHNGFSFGKYQAFLELSQYDSSKNAEDCRDLSMRQIRDLISAYQGEADAPAGGGHHGQNGNGGHGGGYGYRGGRGDTDE